MEAHKNSMMTMMLLIAALIIYCVVGNYLLDYTETGKNIQTFMLGIQIK